ncbi:WD40-repeat-containing domain protein, partial [Blyttiomyces helicus]
QVLSVSWSMDGKRLASGSADRTARVWSNLDKPINKIESIELTGHTGEVDQLKWSPKDPEVLATASVDHSVRLWDMRNTRQSVHRFATSGENINICWHPSATVFAVGNKEDVISIIDVRGGTNSRGDPNTVQTIKNDSETNEISWNYAGDLFFQTTGPGTVKILEYPGWKPIYELKAHTCICYCLDFDPKGRYFATGGADGTACLWDIDDLQCVRTFSRLEWPVRTLSFSHDGELIASGSEGSIVDIASVETGELIYKLQCNAALACVTWHPKQPFLAYASEEVDALNRPLGNLKIFGY